MQFDKQPSNNAYIKFFFFESLEPYRKTVHEKLTTKCVFSKVLGLLLKDGMCCVVLYMFTHSMNNYFVAHD